jgi:hypothetical protein
MYGRMRRFQAPLTVMPRSQRNIVVLQIRAQHITKPDVVVND